MNFVSKETWLFISHFGSADVALPVVLVAAFGLWLDNCRRVVIFWLAALAIGSSIAASTVIAFMGWGLGIGMLDFTGISGHAFLACATLPVILACMLPSPAGPHGNMGLVLGLLLGMLVAWSRIVLGAHSWSEVISGGCLGAAISGVAWPAIRERMASPPRLKWTRLVILPCILLPALTHQTTATLVPAHQWVTRLSLVLSKRDRPYVRGDLQQAEFEAGRRLDGS